MRTLSPADAATLAQEVTTYAICWRVERRDAVLILGTEHDRSIVITTGAYAGTYVTSAGITGSNVTSTSDMSVDNVDVEGAVNNGDLQLVDLSAADIEAGLFDDAAVTLFLVNWESPDDGQIVLRTGNVGQITRTSIGQYKTELRGLAQRLSQVIVRTYGSSCDAELGDARCTVDLSPLTLTGTVTAVASRRRFTASVPADTSPVYDVELYLPMPRTITVGDTFTIRPGCDKSAAMCKARFNNLVNFRGHGFWVPGSGALGMFGGQTASEPTTIGELMLSVLDKYYASHPYEESLSTSGTPWYSGGLVTFTSGENDTFSVEVRRTVAPA